MPGGRPTKYKENFAQKAYEFCASHGFTHKDLAALFDVNKDTITEWMNRHEEFSVSVKKGKDEFYSGEVEKTLINRALGRCKIKEETEEMSPVVSAKTGKPFMRVTKRVTKQLPPDVTAQIFILKNLMSDKYRDRSELHHGGLIHLAAEPMKKPKSAGT